MIASALWLGLIGAGQAVAGGLLLYEVGTPDVGLASAGWGARAQDASTVITNPAGMTRLEGSQVLLGAQALYGDYGFSIGQGTSSGLGTGDGGNPISWLPGGGAFMSFSASPDLEFGFAMAGNFGKVEVGVDSSNPTSNTTNLDYDDTWHGALGAQYRMTDAWMLNFGVAYDSKFQGGSTVSPMLPANDALRFGANVQNQYTKYLSVNNLLLSAVVCITL